MDAPKPGFWAWKLELGGTFVSVDTGARVLSPCELASGYRINPTSDFSSSQNLNGGGRALGCKEMWVWENEAPAGTELGYPEVCTCCCSD